MDWLNYLIVGVMQGILEWLPVSSKGIESLFMVKFFDLKLADALVISLWMHIGTLFAAVAYYWKELKEILLNLPKYAKSPLVKTEANKLTSFVLITTIITGIIGVPLFIFELDKLNFGGKWAMLLIAVFLIIIGIVQWGAKKLKNTEREIKIKDSVLLGIMQGFTAIPGLSRSGMTVSALLFEGYSAREALRLSFLVSIPAVLGVEVLLGLIKGSAFSMALLPGIITSFVFGLISIKILIKFAEKINFGYFCVGFGILIIVSVLLGII